MRKLSELEGVAIGIIRKRQPCTAYALRKELKASPSSHWQASAGAIYPMLERLEQDGFVQGQQDSLDGRGRRLLSVTAMGARAFKSWIKDLAGSPLIADVADPIRTRMFLLDGLNKKEQLEFASRTVQALQVQLEKAQSYLDARPIEKGVFEYLGALGGLINAQGRLEFMQTVLDELS